MFLLSLLDSKDSFPVYCDMDAGGKCLGIYLFTHCSYNPPEGFFNMSRSRPIKGFEKNRNPRIFTFRNLYTESFICVKVGLFILVSLDKLSCFMNFFKCDGYGEFWHCRLRTRPVTAICDHFVMAYFTCVSNLLWVRNVSCPTLEFIGVIFFLVKLSPILKQLRLQ